MWRTDDLVRRAAQRLGQVGAQVVGPLAMGPDGDRIALPARDGAGRRDGGMREIGPEEAARQGAGGGRRGAVARHVAALAARRRLAQPIGQQRLVRQRVLRVPVGARRDARRRGLGIPFRRRPAPRGSCRRAPPGHRPAAGRRAARPARRAAPAAAPCGPAASPAAAGRARSARRPKTLSGRSMRATEVPAMRRAPGGFGLASGVASHLQQRLVGQSPSSCRSARPGRGRCRPRW